MINEVKQHRDFDSVRRAHATYLTALLSKSHVHVRPLMDGIKRMLKLCRKFTLLFNAYSNAADIPHDEVKICFVNYHYCLCNQNLLSAFNVYDNTLSVHADCEDH